MFILEKMDIKPSKPSLLSNKIPFGKKNEQVDFSNDGIKFNDSIKSEVLRNKIKLLEGDDFNKQINEFNAKYGFFKYSIRKISSKSSVAYGSFKNNILSGKVMPGMRKPVNVSNENNMLNFTMNSTSISILENEGHLFLRTLTSNKNKENTHYFHNGIVNNINNNICDLRTTRRKLKKTEILLSITGLIVFIILTIVTFTKILNPRDVSKSFEIIFDKKHSLTLEYTYCDWTSYYHIFLVSLWCILYLSQLLEKNQMLEICGLIL